MTLVSEEDALNEILKGIELAQERIAAGTLGCFHCMKNKATNVILLVTDKIENGAKIDNIRVIHAGICSICEMLASEADKQAAADKLFKEQPQTRSQTGAAGGL